MAALPVQYGQVRWQAVSGTADGNDPDSLPDAVPVTGQLTFTASVPVLLAPGAAIPVSVFLTPVTYDLDNQGVLRDKQGNDLINLVATDSPGLTPTGWTWQVTYRLNDGLTRGSFSFDLPAGTVVDLTTVSPVSTANGAAIIQGPPGPPGSQYPLVIHGATAAYPRPNVATPVIWFGTVRPTNLADGDVYVAVTAES